MFWGLYQTLLLFAGACTLIALVTRRSVVPLGLLSTGLWSVLALQARNIEVVRNVADPPLTTGSEAWQYIALGLALLSLAAVVLYYWGVFPPEDEDASAGGEAPETPTGEWTS